MSPSSPLINARWFGRLSYSSALELQHSAVSLILNAKKQSKPCGNHLLLLEHSPVYTTGIRNAEYPAEEETRLKALGAEFHRANRGGLITFHGPGQLVAYPILNLSHFRPSNSSIGVRRYVNLIEKTIINLLQDQFKLASSTSNLTGVWVRNGQRKIASIGLHVSHGVCSHGLALNCNTDLSWFDQIVPCGIFGQPMTSLSVELDQSITIEQTIQPFCRVFGEIFECQVKLQY